MTGLSSEALSLAGASLTVPFFEGPSLLGFSLAKVSLGDGERAWY